DEVSAQEQAAARCSDNLPSRPHPPSPRLGAPWRASSSPPGLTFHPEDFQQAFFGKRRLRFSDSQNQADQSDEFVLADLSDRNNRISQHHDSSVSARVMESKS